jgi:hypothetical protein
MYRVSHLARGWVNQHLAALSFSETTASLGRILLAMTLALHLAGLAAFWRVQQQPIAFALLSLALLLAIPVLIHQRRGVFAAQTLAPFFFLYAVIAARFIYIRGLGGDIPGYFDYHSPDLRATFFRLEPWATCALIYTLAIQVRNLAERAWRRVLTGAAVALALAAFVWAGALYIGQRTRGVTGTDPYAYAQMGVDLATRGTPLHRFTLLPSIAALDLAWSPIVHTGYHIPINANGDAPTVWPIGGTFAFALAYRVMGEEGLYLVNPLMSLLALAATGWLAWELFRDSEQRAWIVALSIAILATSHTLFDWATVPMVDAQAALFSVLAVGLSLRGAQRSNLPLSGLIGLSLGMAYFVRHTQVLIAPAILILLWRAARVRALIVIALAAVFVAALDLWYHQFAFGGLLAVESTELNLFSLSAVGATASAMLDQLLAAREFGWLVPFLLYGAHRLARDKRAEFILLALWVIALVAFHLPYPALRLRDLLPEFPPLVIVTAFGVVAGVSALWNGEQNWRKFIAACGLIAALFLLLIRVWNVLPIPFGDPQRSFGYVTAAQRASFDQIAALALPRAVIGSSLNTGAIDLYARRETFHPAMWSPRERDAFIAAMFREGRGVFLLDDSAEMSAARRDLQTRYALRQIAALDVPLFGVVDGTPGALWEIRP